MKFLFKEDKDFLLKICLIFTDGIIIFYSFYTAYLIRYGPFSMVGPAFLYDLKMILVAIISWIIVFAYFGFYRMRRGWRYSELVFNISFAVSIGMIIFLAISYMLKEFFYPRLLLIYIWLAAIILITLSRIILKRILVSIRSRGIGIRNVLIVGETPSSKIISKVFDVYPELGYRIIGHLKPDTGGGPFDKGQAKKNESIVGTTSEILNELPKLDIDEILFTLPIGMKEDLWAIVNFCQMKSIQVKMVPDVYQVSFPKMAMEEIEGVPVMKFRPIYLRTWEWIAKISFDYIGSIMILLLSLPAMGLIALLLKRSIKGVVLDNVDRVGQFGAHFGMYRFKLPTYDNPGQSKRATSFGRFLYRYSLAELPELINVLKGEMSLVGPRPEHPERVARYNEWHRRRLMVRPGITGLAQVNGLRGFNSTDEKTLFDLEYIEKQSLFLDIKIFIQTVWILLRRKREVPLVLR